MTNDEDRRSQRASGGCPGSPSGSQSQALQASCGFLRWWCSRQRSQCAPSVSSLQPTQRPPLPVLLYCSASNTHASALPLQLHPASGRAGRGETAGDRGRARQSGRHNRGQRKERNRERRHRRRKCGMDGWSYRQRERKMDSLMRDHFS